MDVRWRERELSHVSDFRVQNGEALEKILIDSVAVLVSEEFDSAGNDCSGWYACSGQRRQEFVSP